MNEDLKKRFGNALFEVEHALSMYASGFCTVPAQAIYDPVALEPLMSTIERCHIYLIGLVPRIVLEDARLENCTLELTYSILENSYKLYYNCLEDWELKLPDEVFYLEDSAGKQFWPGAIEIQQKLSHASNRVHFDVKYVGQAYGQDGSRNALTRLRKHETLQKIAVKGIPSTHQLTLLMLAIEPNTQLITVFNPFAKHEDKGGARIKAGLDKLYNTNEAERIALYEASLIRYFYPEYNKEFKDSFPSTNLKVLQDCYEKDFSAVIAEICIDELPFKLTSAAVAPSNYHIAKHQLHTSAERNIFFGVSQY